jgi:lipoprotein NlpI
MLPIENDRRVPMMEIFRMYRGQTTPEQVLAAAERDPPSEAARAGRLFYAHLYIGLFHEAAGNQSLAEKHIRLAASPRNKHAQVNRYMWDVARVHLERLTKNEEAKPMTKETVNDRIDKR